MTLTAGSKLGPYEIVSQLGQGGMGVVYQAQDPRLDRSVAIKLLPPDLTRDETAKQRFLQEAKAASALDHPNICTIYEINETDDGQLYLVMAHYEGQTLKERIATGALELNDAIDIATQVGEGLSKAHAAGIVHRDIKPANLMVTPDDTVKILDFGLAKLAGSEGVTQTGTTVGTVAYMSPEQAKGQEVDHRTDIWSLGVVLYEMLAGTPPFAGENLLSISNAIMDGTQRALTGPSSSAQSVVTTALNKDKAQRHQAVSDLLTELRTLRSSSDAVTVTAPTKTDVPSIAVLPFRNMSADPEQEYFCEGMAEEIIDALAKLDGLRVVSRSSAFGFKGQSPDLREVGRKLNVTSVLEGSVRKSGDRLRINAQLINAEDGYHLWSERYDRDLADVFAVQDEIARAVVNELQLKLFGGDETPLVRPATNNLEAYNLCLKGRYYYARLTSDDLDKSLDCFNQARRLEPTYAQAHAGIAQVYVISGGTHFADPRTVMPVAREAAVAALGCGETVAEAHFAMASVLHHFDRKWGEAEYEYRRALELNPSDAWTRGNYAFLLATLGRTDAAIAEARAAIERDPISSTGRWVLPQVLVMAREFDAAVAEARAGIELNPDYDLFYWGLAVGLGLLGRNDEAVEALRQSPVLKTGGPFVRGTLGWLLGRAGLTEEARAVMDDLKKQRAEGYVGEVSLAYVCVGLGDSEQAISWLETAFDNHDVQLEYICEGWPVFDPLRADPRFQALLKKMNFPAQA